MSPPVKCLDGSNSEIECGARFDILKKPKKAVKKIAFIVMGSANLGQYRIISFRVFRSMMCLLVTDKGQFILRDLTKYLTFGCSKALNGMSYTMAMAFRAETWFITILVDTLLYTCNSRKDITVDNNMLLCDNFIHIQNPINFLNNIV